MSRHKVLIITSKDDSHADHVIESCNSIGRGSQVVRLNTEDFVSNCLCVFDGDDFEIHLRDSGRSVRGSEIKSVWFRRPAEFEIAETDAGVKEFVRHQANAFLRGAYFCSHDEAKWINPLPALHRSRIKLQQLQLARALGFITPKTLATNIPERAIEFAESVGTVCAKSLDEPTYSLNGAPRALFTKVFQDPDEIQNHSESISHCPVLFQEYVEKIYDLRVVVFYDEVYAFEIHSQAHPLAVHDFRGVAPNYLTHKLHMLPEELRNKILSFVRKQGLNFSVLDLVCSRNDEYVFLENNSNGQWLWLEFETGVKLTDSMLKLLFD